MTQNAPEPAELAESVESRGRTTKTIGQALAGVAAALPLAIVLRGFTVDDALISARMASHLVGGVGYRFNPSGPVVDAVTPLGFAHLLAALGPGSPLEMLSRARFLGLAAWLSAAAYLGVLVGRRASGWRFLLLMVTVALSAPLGAWASSGMETALVTALATFALAQGTPGFACAGLAAALRPELLPWALVLNAGRALTLGRREPGRVAAALALALLPAALVAAVRFHEFGTPAPLAVFAKPSDLTHGLRYALAAFVFGGAPWLLLAPRAIVQSDGETRALLAASGVHFAALALAGGDWMALFRLLVPVLPTLFVAAAGLAAQGSALWFGSRAGLALSSALVLLVTTALPGRGVLQHRLALIDAARPVLAGRGAVAALDAGWVGAATAGVVVDLAGVTDPAIAALPGGHTSKRIPEVLLSSRGAETWVLLLAPGAAREGPWWTWRYARTVEQRLASFELAQELTVRAVLPLGGTEQHYVVVTRSRAGRDRARGALP